MDIGPYFGVQVKHELHPFLLGPVELELEVPPLQSYILRDDTCRRRHRAPCSQGDERPRRLVPNGAALWVERTKDPPGSKRANIVNPHHQGHLGSACIVRRRVVEGQGDAVQIS